MGWPKHMEVRVTAPKRAAFWVTVTGLSFTQNMISVREVTQELHILEAVLFRCLFWDGIYGDLAHQDG